MAFFRPATKPKPKAVTAATALVDLGRGSAWSTWKFGNWDWQVEAWRLYDVVGELRFLAGWIGDSVSQCRLYVTRIDDSGEETGEVDDRRIAQLASVPLGTGSQRDDNLRLLGIDLSVSGEAWIVAEDGNTAHPKNWFVVSGSQLRREGGVVSVDRPIQFGGKVLTLQDGKDLLIRAWRPHPNAIMQSDSPTRSAIPILREIELLTKREFAELESRLVSAGVWFLPEGLDFPRGEDDPEGIEGFMALLQRVAATNIRDQSQSGAMVPIMTTVPDALLEHLDKFKEPTTFWSPVSGEVMEMKDKAIRRLGATFEVPSEILTGIGDSNHWTAWAVGEEGVKRIRPYLATIADTLTRGFLIPTLAREGYEDADQYAYAFDVAPLAVRPNRHTEAMELSDRYLITDEVAVTASAFTPQQMPTEQEKLKMLLFRSVEKDPTLLSDPGVQKILGIRETIAITSPAAPAVGPAPREEKSPADQAPDNLDDGPDDGPPPTARAITAQSLELAVIEGEIADRLRGAHIMAIACDLTVLRALELAGRRIARPGSRTGNQYKHIPAHELHVAHGPVDVNTAHEALVGAWSHLPRVAKKLDIDVDSDALRDTLHGYCVELLTRGMAHHDDLLAATLRTVR